jgi:hypothetical protein
LWLTDTKSSDQRATIPYLLQELCEEYDKQEDTKKKAMDIATHTGFYGNTFILNRSHQLNLDTMEWLTPENFGEPNFIIAWFVCSVFHCMCVSLNHNNVHQLKFIYTPYSA